MVWPFSIQGVCLDDKGLIELQQSYSLDIHVHVIYYSCSTAAMFRVSVTTVTTRRHFSEVPVTATNAITIYYCHMLLLFGQWYYRYSSATDSAVISTYVAEIILKTEIIPDDRNYLPYL